MISEYFKKILIILIRVYQIAISPLFVPCCRFYPSCSEYAMIAVKKHGPLKGAWMAMIRLLKCHPFHPGGYDPVR